MSKEVKINPALIEALNHYACGTYDNANPHLYVHRYSDGRQEPWALEGTCRLAADVLADEELSYLKLKWLKNGLKQMGFEDLYQHIMGEPLEAKK